MTTTGFLHPGEMGVTVAAACSATRIWASEGRSPATRTRAESAGLTDVTTLAALVERADTIVSVCPPAEAPAVAATVAALGFDGVYVDANAVSPATTARIAARFDRFVDGGIVGPPAQQAGSTRMYLSGDEAAALAERWNGSILEVRAIRGGVGAASALKMCFAAWGKHNQALLLAINAVAEAYGVTAALHSEWAVSRPDHPARSEAAARQTSRKAWRFEGEMHEIADTFAAAGLPPDMFVGAAEIYRRMAGFKDADPPPDLAAVLTELLRAGRSDGGT
jgi:3-hydroxyisobutyrate dehydrogenase-like beta-hydroxyacid dehydrogenase